MCGRQRPLIFGVARNCIEHIENSRHRMRHPEFRAVG
jgi:hypothetical protein